jgi:urea transport system ATP-binding protein
LQPSGEQQRAIVRALVTRPRLLALDQPTEGIQPSIIGAIDRAIADLRALRQMATLLDEQYFEVIAALAHQRVLMDRGEVAATRQPDALDPAELRLLLMV